LAAEVMEAPPLDTGKVAISSKVLADLIRRADLNGYEMDLVIAETKHPQLPDMSNMDEVRGGEFWGRAIPEEKQAVVKKTWRTRSDRILAYWKPGEEFRHWVKRRAHVGGPITFIFGVKSDGQRAQFTIAPALVGYQGRHGTKTGAEFTGWAKEACDQFLEVALTVNWNLFINQQPSKDVLTKPPIYISAELVASDISGDGNEHKGIPADHAYFVVHYITINGQLADLLASALLQTRFREVHRNGFMVAYETNKKSTKKTVFYVPEQHLIPPITYHVGQLGTEKEAEILSDFLHDIILTRIVPLMDDRKFIETVLSSMYGKQIDLSKMTIEGAILQAFSDRSADGAHCIKMKKELGWNGDKITTETFLGGPPTIK